MIRRLTIGAAVIGCTGALLVPVAAASAGTGCASVPALQSSKITTRSDLGSGTSLTIWRDPIRSGNWWESRQLQLTLVKADLSSVAMDVRSNGFPGGTDPAQLVTQPGEADPIALINGDFFDMFDTGDSSPHGPVISNGQLIYAPYSKTFVAGQTVKVIPADEIQRGVGSITSGRTTVPLKSFNVRRLATSSAVVYDRRWTGGALPVAAVALVTRNGIVTRIAAHAALPKPTGAVQVIAVPRSLVTAVARIKVGAKVAVAFTPTDGTSSKPRTVTAMESTRARVKGTLTVGGTTIPIGAVNYHSVSGSLAGAFDTHWSSARLPKASATIVYSQGRITDVFRRGSRALAPAGATVVQLPANLARLATKVRVGDAAALDIRLRTDTGSTFTEALGVGNYMLRSGSVHASCTWSAETVRPRTAMGWDDQGHIYLLTATSGRKDGYGGFRTGGATQNEMATWLIGMGATHAVNLDGGGSTILMVKRSGSYQRIDLPANSWRRPVPDAIALVPRV